MMRGNLQLAFEQFALNSGEFELPLSGITVLFGRSGSGKSTLLRAMSGLDKRTVGELSVNDEIWQRGSYALPPQKRHIGFVFQDAALFPHLNVKQNLFYGIKRLPKNIAPANFNDIVERVGIADKLDRAVTFLSGGEKQRVAIARALLMQPKLLFMDEPLSALDWRAKAQLLTLIEELVHFFKIPVFYITHAPNEVERLADRIVFMKSGHIETIETLQQALSRMDSPLFDEQGVVSVLSGKCGEKTEYGLRQVQLGDDQLWLSEAHTAAQQLLRVVILAKDVSVALSDPHDTSVTNHLKTTITSINEEDNHRLLVRLQLQDGQHLFAEVTRRSADRLQFKVGQTVYALIKAVAIME
ncbi:molybdenum ABC transporter ATP-binding protein [Thioflexithrix psekupsensis]|uniref:Molybdenum ABC transporter ATP-binding protein n=1 Tax=Thioflexithrix psekupsensis TaxID=1570016 RepID=A0A251X5Z1_9GAMM|nr:molybdenum ABC transporter ATP-binding protein [Thioflexithrix psekupsensis]OUD12619.1 molybdenum ABC transporter ATP-binding protein [Thioflexithrix psekupsensis]